MTVATSRGSDAIPPVSGSLLVAPAWSHYVDMVRGRPGKIDWHCPEDGCSAINGSAALLGDHLTTCHNWTETELRGWWTGDR